jgi:glycogen debranching enzyme
MTAPPLLDLARDLLRKNDAGPFTKPGPRQYPHQWNWDSALIALGLSHFDLPRALIEIRSLLRGQWKDGMLPHVVYHDAPSNYFPDPAFWQIGNSPNASTVPTSGITQPPLLTTLIRRIHLRHSIPEFIHEVYPSLLKWHRWLHTARDTDRSGLAFIIHPWESGTDDSPRWLKVMASIQPQDVPGFRRGDTLHVPAMERPHQGDYERFIHLIDLFRRENYEPNSLRARSPFLVQDVLFNSILHRADEDLRALAAEFGFPTAEIDNWMRTLQFHFTHQLWDEATGLFYDYDLRSGMPIAVNTAAAFLPLFGGLASKEQAERLVRGHLQNPKEYAPGDQVRFWLTTTSQSEADWEARRYWRGPIWIILNWLVIEGLQRYDYNALAGEIQRDSLELLARSGFREYYDPRDGSGCGSTDFSWSAALAFELQKNP